ncbi:MAG: hypothetical protein ABF337_12855 [Akkermansiaceae bacterium]
MSLLVGPPVIADESSSNAKVIGGISDGKPSAPQPPKKIPEFKVHWSTVHQKKDHKVIFNKVAAPNLPKLVPQPVDELSMAEIERRHEEVKKWISDVKESGGFFIVSATVYDHKTTHVRWWNGKEEYACYSNVDWNHLGGFHEFEGRGKRFNMILFSANASTARMRKEVEAGYRNSLPEIPKLPALAAKGAAYMVVKGDEDNEEAMEFMEAIHDLYDANRAELVSAWREREKNHKLYLKQREEQERNPPPKPDVIINYWKEKRQPRQK